ncbi:MAG: 3-deoxy-D-manno-octulosonic acid transferase [Verrucomicrobia bacterium]|nr:3-deoxy-D-manno-octulosonic acid transferase [Verrucomicrobiota bacterium]
MTQFPEPLLKIGYNLLFTAGFALTWPYFTYLIWRRQPFWERLGERLGHYPREVKEWLQQPDRPVWIHAVSVGEVLLARVLVRELRRLRPQLRVFLTVGTPTGRRMAGPLLDDKTSVVYVPTDFYYSMMRAFRRVNPQALILVENEIWPNMLWRAKKMGIPVCLVNSRLSRRNRRLFRAARTFVRPVLQAFDWIGVQSQEDLGRFAIAGFPEQRLHLMGSMKYDVADLVSDNPGKGGELRTWAGWNQGQVVLLGGSTHPGEEQVLADLLRKLKPKHPKLRLMLVPRHVERKGEILQQCSSRGLKVGLRSRLEEGKGSDPDILLVDSTGELRDLYPACELVFIGKTLTGTGGQNFLEAARHGRAIVAGPHMENFQSLRREFLQDEAMVISPDPAGLEADLDRLLTSTAEREELGRRAQACFRKHLGAGARHVESILRLLANRR